MKMRKQLLVVPFVLLVLLFLGACSDDNPIVEEEVSSSSDVTSSDDARSSDGGDNSTGDNSSSTKDTDSSTEGDQSSRESGSESSGDEPGSSEGGESSSEVESSAVSTKIEGYTEDDWEEYHSILTKAGYPISIKESGLSGFESEETSDLPTDSISKGLKVAAGETLEFSLNDEGARPLCRITGIRMWIKGEAEEEVEISVKDGSTAATSKVAITNEWQRITESLQFAEGTIDGRKAEGFSITAGAESLIVADIALVVIPGDAGLKCETVLDYTIESEQDIRNLIDGMSDEAKAAQICMAGWNSGAASDWVGRGLGSYLDNDRDFSTFISNYNSYQQGIIDNGGIPPIHSADAVHGNYMPNAVVFPHNIGMGATGNPDLVERVAEAIATELSATGVRWNLSPTVAVSRDERWGTNVQPDDTNYPIDRTDVDLTDAELDEIHIPPYEACIENGALSIMSAYNTIKGEKIHGSAKWLTEKLKVEMGFKGMVVSDWNGMWLIENDRYGAVVKGLNAGLDVLMAPGDVFSSGGGEPLYESVLKAIQSGDVSSDRIEDALFRQLWVKWKVGLFDDPRAEGNSSVIGSQAHRAIARQAVRESMVLLKNDTLGGNTGLSPVVEKTLPLKKEGQKIAVAGAHANSAALQSGGWTIGWQGPGSHHYDGATTILDGMKEYSNEIVYDDGNNFVADADIAVLIVGEQPYAEGVGDRTATDLILGKYDFSHSNSSHLDPGDQLGLFNQYADAGIPVVFVLVTGRPLVVTEQVKKAGAFMVAWLPGSEGAGVADVLFGDYSPTGKLPQTWPETTSQIPINEGDGQTPLYDLGAGLPYK